MTISIPNISVSVPNIFGIEVDIKYLQIPNVNSAIRDIYRKAYSHVQWCPVCQKHVVDLLAHANQHDDVNHAVVAVHCS
jgi:hypothetical protein